MMRNIHGICLHARHALKRRKPITFIALFFQSGSARRSLRREKIEPAEDSVSNLRCHIMVINSLSYVLLAEICVNSFLKHNPRTVFMIHTDKNLTAILRKRFSSLINDNRVLIVESVSNVSGWQRSKLELILAMNGTYDIFMDADLRWNGPLLPIDKVTFYLREFCLGDSDLYKSAFPALGFTPNDFMYNLSFFTFSGVIFSKKEVDDTFSLQTAIKNFDSARLGHVETAGLRRMSEQLAISITASRLGLPLNTLKLSDQRNDGDFVESCYFGATGLAF